ncbi:MAG: hypothetical protein ACPGLV_15660, partial [Bacteroidia bacterium]
TVVLINYVVCFTVGSLHLLLKATPVVFNSTIASSSAIMGLLFISMFYLMGVLTNKNGVAVSSIVSRLSLVIPTLFFFLFYNEPISVKATIGIAIAILSIILVNNKANKSGSKFSGFLPLIVFIGYGLVDIGLKLSQTLIAKFNDAQHEMTLGIFAFAGIYGWLGKFIFRVPLQKKSIVIGLVLGVVNYYSIFFFLHALQKVQLASTVVFPINGIAILLLANLASILVFKEKIGFKKAIALVLATISIVLLSS